VKYDILDLTSDHFTCLLGNIMCNNFLTKIISLMNGVSCGTAPARWKTKATDEWTCHERGLPVLQCGICTGNCMCGAHQRRGWAAVNEQKTKRSVACQSAPKHRCKVTQTE